jgi:hypothetical protein
MTAAVIVKTAARDTSIITTAVAAVDIAIKKRQEARGKKQEARRIREATL